MTNEKQNLKQIKIDHKQKIVYTMTSKKMKK